MVLRTILGRTHVVEISDLSKPNKNMEALQMIKKLDDIEYYPFAVKDQIYLFNKNGRNHYEDKLIQAILNGIHI